jgi:methylmalonyl-CoA mutase cobalamin-binding domain/chain
MDRLEMMREALVELQEERTLALAEAALADGIRAVLLLDSCEKAMRIIGERYERQEYYLSGLILAGEIFREVLELASVDLERELSGDGAGRILLGTAPGDIHDIGKNIAATALRGFGFTVMDLGVNVPPARFLEAAQEFDPDVVGISGLVTPAFKGMKETVQALREGEHQLARRPTIILGGGVDEEVRLFVGADAWTSDALEGVRLCQRFTTRGQEARS